MLEVSHNISQLLWVHILPIQSFCMVKVCFHIFYHLLHSSHFIVEILLLAYSAFCLVQVDRLICHLCISIEAKLERCIHIAPVVSEKVERDNSYKVNL